MINECFLIASYEQYSYKISNNFDLQRLHLALIAGEFASHWYQQTRLKPSRRQVQEASAACHTQPVAVSELRGGHHHTNTDLVSHHFVLRRGLVREEGCFAVFGDPTVLDHILYGHAHFRVGFNELTQKALAIYKHHTTQGYYVPRRHHT